MSRMSFDGAASAPCPLPLAQVPLATHDGGMDTRLARLETTTEHLRQDVGNIRRDVDHLRQDVSNLRATTEHLRATTDYLRHDLGNLRLEMRDMRVELKGDIHQLQHRARSDFRLLFGALISVALGLSGLMAKGFHWV